MTNLIKRTAKAAILATILAGTVLSAQAQVIRPAPKPGNPFGGVANAACLTPNQVAARMASNVKNAGYLDTFHYTKFPDGRRLQAFGVKDRNQWYAFIVELCYGTIVTEGLQKQKPPFL